MQVTAVAHPNIALIKYWGKQQTPGNRPAVPSLSVTLDTLCSKTRVAFDSELSSDNFTLDGVPNPWGAARVGACLDEFRRLSGRREFAWVDTENNFPTAAGLASSASGFAALVVAANMALKLDLSREELSRIARASSGSAARSLYGGFVEMPLAPEEETAQPLLEPGQWPLSVVIAVTDARPKGIGSSEGMIQTAQTSDYYAAWLDTAEADYFEAREAVLQCDFKRLARVSEKSCLKMHGLMLSADPGLIYWNEASVSCLHRIRALREQGAGVFFTMDAGPQVKAVCLPEDRERVAASLGSIPGVEKVIVCGLGPGARIFRDTE